MTILKTRATARNLLVVAAALAITAGPSLSDPLPKIEKKFENGGVLRFYGQINKGFLVYDDGQETETYDLIDNQNSNTRFGLTFDHDFSEGWNYLGTIEIQYAPFSTNTTSSTQPSPPDSAYDLTAGNIRKIDNQFSSDQYGGFYIGQGNMASQDTAEVDLSGTTVIAKSAVQESAAGQLLRLSDGTLSSITIKSAFTNYNGLGRKVRIRYDTPAFGGFTFRTSFGRNLLFRNSNQAQQDAVQGQNLYDAAIAYAGASGDFTYAAQIAYSYQDQYTVNGTVTPSTKIWDGSGSVLHTPTGLNLTAALGQQDNGTFDGNYGFAKAGWLGDVVAWGKTAVAIDYYDGTDINGNNSESRSRGISVVQYVTDWNTEFWATYRQYAYDQQAADFQDSSAFFVGARFKF